MRTRLLDRHVRKEARLLVRDARRLRGKSSEHDRAIEAVAKALAARDLGAVRRAMPALDDVVQELAKTAKMPTHYQALDALHWLVSLALLVFVLRTFVVQVFQIPSSSMYPTLMINDNLFVNKFIYGLDIPFSDAKLIERSPKRGEVIVFAQPCTPERDYIKRVIAVAGDTVEVRCHRIYINGVVVPEERVDDPSCSYEDRDGSRWLTRYCSRYRETLGGYTYETFHEADRPAQDATGSGSLHDFPALRDRSPAVCGMDPDMPPAPNQAPGEYVDVKSAAACEPQAHYVVPPGHVFVMGDNRAHSNDSRFWGSVPLENIRGKALFIWLSYKELSPTGLRYPRMGEFVH